MLRVGIVGLPNVGKSTLFNALTQAAVAQGYGARGKAALVRNVPFTTIEPNIGVVPVPDERLEKLAAISKSAKVTPTTIEFVDIAGLVKNAHQGEGLGNKFLSHIREVDAIIHVVRFFEDPNITHVESTVDPQRDVETINTELALADLATVERAAERNADLVKAHDPASAQGSHLRQGYGGQAGGQSKEAKAREPILNKLLEELAAGNHARDYFADSRDDDTARKLRRELNLLTDKPVLYVANVSESHIRNAEEIVSPLVEGTKRSQDSTHYHRSSGIPQRRDNLLVLPLSIKIEQELVELPDEEGQTFLQEYGLTHTGLERLIQASYALLHLITFFTSGPTETRAWTVPAGSSAPEAAGKIHSDFERGFIRAETVAYQDLIAAGTRQSGGQAYAAARAAGKVRDEGKQYIVKDGDVILFKFSV